MMELVSSFAQFLGAVIMFIMVAFLICAGVAGVVTRIRQSKPYDGKPPFDPPPGGGKK